MVSARQVGQRLDVVRLLPQRLFVCFNRGVVILQIQIRVAQVVPGGGEARIALNDRAQQVASLLQSIRLAVNDCQAVGGAGKRRIGGDDRREVLFREVR